MACSLMGCYPLASTDACRHGVCLKNNNYYLGWYSTVEYIIDLHART